MDLLVRIKRCALGNRLRLTAKARDEMNMDCLTIQDIREALVNADHIDKTLRSANPVTGKREHLHVIKSRNFSGVLIYTKGKLIVEQDQETFYLLVSGKHAL